MIPVLVSLAAAAAPAVFACNLHALSHAECVQHARNTQTLTAAMAGTQELEDGFRFRIAEDRADLGALAEWVRLERKCCPFFRFNLEVQQAETWLSLSGPAGVKDFIRLELGVR